MYCKCVDHILTNLVYYKHSAYTYIKFIIKYIRTVFKNLAKKYIIMILFSIILVYFYALKISTCSCSGISFTFIFHNTNSHLGKLVKTTTSARTPRLTNQTQLSWESRLAIVPWIWIQTVAVWDVTLVCDRRLVTDEVNIYSYVWLSMLK